MNLEGHNVVVVGGSSGIGWAVAKAVLAKGAEVVLAARNHDKLEKARAELGAGARVRSVVADIGREADVARLLEEARQGSAAQTVHHVVVTAADPAYQPLPTFDIEGARRVIDSKLLGPFLVAKHAAGVLDPQGSMTFTSGIAFERPAPQGSMVAAANGGIVSLVRALAIELAPIRVNTLSPGWVDTPIWDRLAGDSKPARFAQMAERLPARRIGRPEELAHAAIFLMENTFTTGTVLHVDGGHRMA
ncbi:SDR family oxidoreductase [Pendulispora albinea]|uniref:SDR family oxidoreductase n=1 Tax=Pendulispora albinea TaxID=2741071 RepID=A0ABZ2M565_9BACT